MIFEAYTQTPNLHFEATLQHFLGFFVSRLFLRASRTARMEEQRKNIKIDPSKDPKSTQDRPESLFGALFDPFLATKSVEETFSSDLGAAWSVEKACRSACRGLLGRSWRARG